MNATTLTTRWTKWNATIGDLGIDHDIGAASATT